MCFIDAKLPDMDGKGAPTYLDNQSLERIIIDKNMISRAIDDFIERLEKRRIKQLSLK